MRDKDIKRGLFHISLLMEMLAHTNSTAAQVMGESRRQVPNDNEWMTVA